MLHLGKEKLVHVPIRHGISGGAWLGLPWCTSSLCSVVWEQCAALSASPVPLCSLPQRQGLALFLFLCARRSLFHVQSSTQPTVQFTSFTLLLIAFTFPVHIVTLPCYYKCEPRSHFYHSYRNFSLFVSLKFKSFTSFSLFTFTCHSVSSFTSCQLCSFLPCQVSVNIHLTSLNKSLCAFVAPNGQNVFSFFSKLKKFHCLC